MTQNQLTLENLRKTIDQLDAGILDLLDKRMKTALKIVEAKKELGREVYDEEREQKLFEVLKQRNQETLLPDEKVLEIWGKIIEISRQLQNSKV